MSQLEQEIQEKVARIKTTFSEPEQIDTTPGEQEIREYIDQVIEEITQLKKQDKRKDGEG